MPKIFKKLKTILSRILKKKSKDKIQKIYIPAPTEETKFRKKSQENTGNPEEEKTSEKNQKKEEIRKIIKIAINTGNQRLKEHLNNKTKVYKTTPDTSGSSISSMRQKFIMEELKLQIIIKNSIDNGERKINDLINSQPAVYKTSPQCISIREQQKKYIMERYRNLTEKPQSAITEKKQKLEKSRSFLMKIARPNY